MNEMLTPKDAAVRLGISVATISRCVKRGAPVHRWGSTGARYRIVVSEFVRWMEAQGGPEQKTETVLSIDEFAARRRAMFSRTVERVR